jgi:hypothetical protein
MARGRIGRFGRTRGIRLVVFRVSADERRRLEAAAAAVGASVNELSRRRALGQGDSGSPRQTAIVQTQVKGDGYRVEYEE